MTDWQPISSAPLTGKAVLVAAMPVIYDMKLIEEFKQRGLYKAKVFYARYSTWDNCWRSFPDGKKLDYSEAGSLTPHAWAEVTEPPVREEEIG